MKVIKKNVSLKWKINLGILPLGRCSAKNNLPTGRQVRRGWCTDPASGGTKYLHQPYELRVIFFPRRAYIIPQNVPMERKYRFHFIILPIKCPYGTEPEYEIYIRNELQKK